MLASGLAHVHLRGCKLESWEKEGWGVEGWGEIGEEGEGVGSRRCRRRVGALVHLSGRQGGGGASGWCTRTPERGKGKGVEEGRGGGGLGVTGQWVGGRVWRAGGRRAGGWGLGGGLKG